MQIDCQQTHKQVARERDERLQIWRILSEANKKLTALGTCHFDGDEADIETCMVLMNQSVCDLNDAMDEYEAHLDAVA